MPIYEFICPKNQRIYSFFARSISYADKIPKCPDNPKWKLERLLSNFAVTGRAKEPSAGPAGDMDDSKMEAAMEAKVATTDTITVFHIHSGYEVLKSSYLLILYLWG